jgi:hypothetical protein
MASARTTEETNAIPPDDAWAYTPENRARILRASGRRGYRLSEEDVLAIIAKAEEAEREGREYHISRAELEEMEAKHLAAGE